MSRSFFLFWEIVRFIVVGVSVRGECILILVFEIMLSCFVF